MPSHRRGIRRFGAYLPRLRLERSAIATATAFAAGSRAGAARGTRSCANWDEDSVTMAVEAARDCLAGLPADDIGELCFASTTHPFADRSNAGIVATALNLQETVRVADAAGCQRAGAGALLQALESTGSRSTLVVAADRRLARPASDQESTFGHGAAAILVGDGNDVTAELLGAATLHDDFVDHYRASDSRFDYALEERWVRDEAYLQILPQAIAAAIAEAGLAAADVDRFILQGPARFAALLAKACGLNPAAIQDDLHGHCGNTGVAHPLLQLGAALEAAGAGEIVLLASFGQGCDALVFRTTGRSPTAGRGAAGSIAAGRPDTDYLRFLSNCGLVDVDWGMRAERDNRTAQSVAWRKHRDVTGFVGGRCTRCDTVQFPRSRACVNPECRAFDTQEPHALAGLTGKVKTYTEDWLAVTRSPPHVYGNVALDGGGNVFAEFADTPAGTLAVGMPVRFVFRIKDFDGVRGFRRYFWKATPAEH